MDLSSPVKDLCPPKICANTACCIGLKWARMLARKDKRADSSGSMGAVLERRGNQVDLTSSPLYLEAHRAPKGGIAG